MGKAERGTPKDIANRMKAKGLQKLRWYCQMCEKQCRDENGFKCHIISESHQRQMKLIAHNPDKFMSNFSTQFLNGFMDMLAKRYGTRRVNANHVYQEFIRDRNHIHMNSTKWHSLTEFVTYLGRESLCVVEDTERGWFIQWIDNSPSTLAKREAESKKAKVDHDYEVLERKMIDRQIQRASELVKEDEEPLDKSLKREEDVKITLSLNKNAKSVKPKVLLDDIEESVPKIESDKPVEPEKSPKHKLEKESIKKRPVENVSRIVSSELPVKKPVKKSDSWLFPNIVIKILNKRILEGKLYKKKGLVTEVLDDYLAVVKVFDTNQIVQLDQDDCETVIPAIGSKVFIVNGEHRGVEGTLTSVDFDKFQGCIKTDNGEVTCDYEDFCKFQG